MTGARAAALSLSSSHLHPSSGHRWQAQIRNPATKQRDHIGTYGTEIEAARAYDVAARQRGKPTNLPPHTHGQAAAVKKPPSSKFRGVSWDSQNKR